MWIARDPDSVRRPVLMSQGEYEIRVGLNRILDILDKFGLKTTFFVPGWVVDHHLEAIKEIHRRGHELAHHGYLHEWLDYTTPLDKEKEILKKGIDSLKKITGENPLGYRSPAWELSPNTIKLLVDHCFVYDSCFMNDEFPYFLELDGKVTDLVELPVHWVLDDAPYMSWSMRWHSQKVMANPSHVLEIWKGEFDGYYEDGGCYMLVCHPQLIGRPHRAKMLEELLQYITGHPNAWFGKCIEIANHFKQTKSRS
ncbi:MAG: polysaccharide deacetylase [Candidatus Bathyarchaeia archaeon]